MQAKVKDMARCINRADGNGLFALILLSLHFFFIVI